jgi:hypothetical protein
MGLPSRIERVIAWGAGEPEGATARVRPRQGGTGFDAEVLGPDGRLLLRVEGYDTAQLPEAVEDAPRGPLSAALA